MKRFYFPFILFFIAFTNLSTAQNKKPSTSPYAMDLFGKPYSAEQISEANEVYYKQLINQNPDWNVSREVYERLIYNSIKQSKTNLLPKTTITIPVVVHIIYNLPIQNISDAQVLSQMIVLNEDFSRSAADTVNTPAAFKPFAGNPNIQFCLAKRDPNGNQTTGIERRQTSVISFGSDSVKFFSLGGLNIWDPTLYFNIWVCNTGGVCWGEFPTTTVTNTYGAVMNYFYMGSNFTSYGYFPVINPYYNRGELCVHEIGHCLNLRHIWGDDGTACWGSDSCADTPNQQGPTPYCPSFPQYDSCTSSGNGIMFMNFMDYSDDDCYNLFTLDQVARMNAVLSIAPYNGLTVSNGCLPLGIDETLGEKKNLFFVYPNPFSNSTIIEFLNPKNENCSLSLYNSQGQLVRTISDITTNEVELERKNLSNGLYFFNLQTNCGILASGKLIIE